MLNGETKAYQLHGKKPAEVKSKKKKRGWGCKRHRALTITRSENRQEGWGQLVEAG